MLESHRLTTRRCRSTLAEESQAKRIHTAKLLAAMDKFPCSSLLLSRTSLLLFACQCDSCVEGSSSLSGDFPTHCPVSPPRSQTYSVCSVKWTCHSSEQSDSTPRLRQCGNRSPLGPWQSLKVSLNDKVCKHSLSQRTVVSIPLQVVHVVFVAYHFAKTFFKKFPKYLVLSLFSRILYIEIEDRNRYRLLQQQQNR